MSDKPILFSGPMVRALLEGRKTQTRRVSKIQDWPEAIVSRYPHQKSGVPYAVGDRLYVREAWRTTAKNDPVAPRDLAAGCLVSFEADYDDEPNDGCRGKFRQGMHMPRWASRLTLTVTEVRVQRLQEISGNDAEAEGVTISGPDVGVYRDHASTNAEAARRFDSYRTNTYRALWDHLNAERGFGWDANPWVVAVSFSVQFGNIDQLGAAA